MTKDHLKISAVVTTYKRKDLLIDCLKSLLSQTKGIEEIYVIDNSPEDDTFEYIKSKIQDFSQIKYVPSDRNLGGAGGFAKGINAAISDGTEKWMWLMDDDVEPAKDCLEKMLEYSSHSDCIHPSRFYSGERFYWEHVYDPNTGLKYLSKDKSFLNKKFSFVNTGCFEGMLVKSTIAKKVGTLFENFFIIEDDTLFGFLASFYTNVIYVKDAEIEKKILPSQKLDWKAYYYFRNRIFVKRILDSMELRDSRYDFFYWIAFSGMILKYLYSEASFDALKRVFFGTRDGIFNPY